MRRISPARKVLFSLVPAALLAVGAEGAARLLEAKQGRTPLAYEAISPVAFHQLPQGLEVPQGKHPWDVTEVTVVSDAVADLDGQGWEQHKEPDELRIVFVGGSALGGWGVATPALHTSIVQRLLDEASPKRVRVLNLGHTGWASPQLRWTVDRVLPALQPDLVVTVMGNNERMDVANALWMADGDVEAVLEPRDRYRRWALRRLRAPRAVRDEGAAPQGMPSRTDLPPLEGWDGWVQARTVRSVRAMRGFARSMGAELLVSSIPVNHRYHELGHEWFFVGEERFRSEPFRTAHWGLRYGAPEAAVAAMEGVLTERPDDAAAWAVLAAAQAAAGQVVTAAERALALLPSWEEGGHEGILRVWAQSHVDPEAAQAQARAAVAAARAESTIPFAVCSTPELLWYAGAKEEAAAVFEECLLSRMFYRADGTTNATLKAAADRAGAGFVDLDGVARQHSEAGVPDFDLFYDYCHYSPRGNVLVGHALAAAIAEQLGIDADLPTVAEALATHDAAFAGRLHDALSIHDFAGVEWDPTNLVALRVDPQNDSRRGPEQSPLDAMFVANRNAAQANWSYWEAVPVAADGYLRIIEANEDPALVAAARANLAWLLEQPWAQYWLADAEPPWPDRVALGLATR